MAKTVAEIVAEMRHLRARLASGANASAGSADASEADAPLPDTLSDVNRHAAIAALDAALQALGHPTQDEVGVADPSLPADAGAASTASAASLALSEASGDQDLPADNLKRIRGISSATATALADAGITRFDQLANLSAADVAALRGKLGYRFTCHRDGWIEQAAILASGGQTHFSARTSSFEQPVDHVVGVANAATPSTTAQVTAVPAAPMTGEMPSPDAEHPTVPASRPAPVAEPIGASKPTTNTSEAYPAAMPTDTAPQTVDAEEETTPADFAPEQPAQTSPFATLPAPLVVVDIPGQPALDQFARTAADEPAPSRVPVATKTDAPDLDDRNTAADVAPTYNPITVAPMAVGAETTTEPDPAPAASPPPSQEGLASRLRSIASAQQAAAEGCARADTGGGPFDSDPVREDVSGQSPETEPAPPVEPTSPTPPVNGHLPGPPVSSARDAADIPAPAPFAPIIAMPTEEPQPPLNNAAEVSFRPRTLDTGEPERSQALPSTDEMANGTGGLPPGPATGSAPGNGPTQARPPASAPAPPSDQRDPALDQQPAGFGARATIDPLSEPFSPHRTSIDEAEIVIVRNGQIEPPDVRVPDLKERAGGLLGRLTRIFDRKS